MEQLKHFGIKTRMIRGDTKSYNKKCLKCGEKTETIGDINYWATQCTNCGNIERPGTHDLTNEQLKLINARRHKEL
jgi:uncharacterized Zn finger protein